MGALKKWYMHGQWVDVSCIQESGASAHNSWIKSLDRFYNAMLPFPTGVLTGKVEFKLFQHCMYFSSAKAAAGL